MATSPTELHKTIGQRLAALRISRGTSSRTLADILGISTNLLTRLERGQSEVTADILVRAAAALGVTSAVLTGEELYPDFRAKRRGSGKST